MNNVCFSLKSTCHQSIQKMLSIAYSLEWYLYEPVVEFPHLVLSNVNKKWIFDGYLMISHFIFNVLGHLFDKHPIATDGKVCVCDGNSIWNEVEWSKSDGPMCCSASTIVSVVVSDGWTRLELVCDWIENHIAQYNWIVC